MREQPKEGRKLRITRFICTKILRMKEMHLNMPSGEKLYTFGHVPKGQHREDDKAKTP